MSLRVGILPHADLPHIIPCFRICRELLKWDHEIQILGSDLYAFGDRGHSDAWSSVLETYRLSDHLVIHRSADMTFSDWLIQQLRELKLDVIILDALWQALAFACHDADLVSSVVVHHAGLPDFRCRDMPPWAFVHPAHSRHHWSQARSSIEHFEQGGLGIRAKFSTLMELSATGKTDAIAYDFGCGEFADLPAIRAMSLCPAAEFPNERGRIDYFGTLLPKPEDVDWTPPPCELTDNSKPLIACVFGTSGLQSKQEYDWLSFLAKSLANAFPNSQVVAVIPDSANSPGLTDCPKNLLVYPWIQLWEFLSTRKGSKVLVTTPGIGAFREAIASGTPMVAIPRQLDQFGAAARVEYFKAGLSLVTSELPQPDVVIQHVGHVLEDHEIQTKTQQLCQEFKAFDATLPLKRFFENPVSCASHFP